MFWQKILRYHLALIACDEVRTMVPQPDPVEDPDRRTDTDPATSSAPWASVPGASTTGRSDAQAPGIVARMLALPVAAIAVVVPWLLGPLVGGYRWSGRWADAGWHPRPSRITSWSAPMISLGSRFDRTPRERWQPRVVGLAVLAMLAVGAITVRSRPEPVAPRPSYSLTQAEGVQLDGPEVPAAFAGEAWYPTYTSELQYAATWFDAIPLVDGLGLKDFRSTYVNTEGGYRETWSPPPCDCPRFAVWLYGASTVFGLGQRDEYTIASQLARLAWEDGIALDVVNKGMPGEQHWQETNRLRWDLTRQPAPDLVVFYDGASEIVAASWVAEERRADPDQPVEPLTELVLESEPIAAAVREAKAGGQTRPPVPDGVEVTRLAEVAERTPEEVAALALRSYGRAREMSTTLADQHGLEVTWFWQPTRFSRPPIEGEQQTEQDPAGRRTAEAAVSGLPPGVVDLTEVFDATTEPLFSDDVHHNERGAELVASAMYQRLAPSLTRLGDKDGS